MKKIFIFTFCICFIWSNLSLGFEGFKEKMNAFGELREVETGYEVDVELSLFNDNANNINVLFFGERTLNLVGNSSFDGKTVSSVTKTYSLMKPFNKDGASKTMNGNMVTVFIPFADVEIEKPAETGNETYLIQAKNNLNKTLKKGLKYKTTGISGSRTMVGVVYQNDKFTRTEFTDGRYSITWEDINDAGQKRIFWYDSPNNVLNIQTMSDREKFENIFIDNPENYRLYVKGDTVDTYDIPCTTFTKNDINENKKICLDIDNGILVFTSVEGRFERTVSEIEIKELDQSLFKTPEDAKIEEIKNSFD